METWSGAAGWKRVASESLRARACISLDGRVSLPRRASVRGDARRRQYPRMLQHPRRRKMGNSGSLSSYILLRTYRRQSPRETRSTPSVWRRSPSGLLLMVAQRFREKSYVWRFSSGESAIRVRQGRSYGLICLVFTHGTLPKTNGEDSGKPRCGWPLAAGLYFE